MLKGLFKKTVQLSAPMVGQIIRLEEVPDEVFSGKMIGEGFAVNPASGQVVSPVDGEIIQIFPTKHAIGIKTKEGLEILIHVGIDTVELKGQGFEAFIEKGSQVKAGDLLLEVDKAYVEAQGKSMITPIVFTNPQNYKSIDVNYGESSGIVCEVKV